MFGQNSLIFSLKFADSWKNNDFNYLLSSNRADPLLSIIFDQFFDTDFSL